MTLFQLIMLLVVLIKPPVLTERPQCSPKCGGVLNPRKVSVSYTSFRFPSYPIHKPKFHLPENFDTREKWPDCRIVREAEMEKNCANDWAISVSSVISDRWCIAFGSENQNIFSSQDLTSCCRRCVVNSPQRNACNGGDVSEAFCYWITKGIVSKACLPPDNRRVRNNFPHPCERKCQNESYPVPYKQDRRKGFDVYRINKNVSLIQWEIFLFGPVHAILQLHEDFVDMEPDKIYYPRGKISNFWHGVVIIGWGNEKGAPYWLVKTSMADFKKNSNGFCKIHRGGNVAFIEEFVGVPIVSLALRSGKMESFSKISKQTSSTSNSTIITINSYIINIIIFLLIDNLLTKISKSII